MTQTVMNIILVESRDQTAMMKPGKHLSDEPDTVSEMSWILWLLLDEQTGGLFCGDQSDTLSAWAMLLIYQDQLQ